MRSFATVLLAVASAQLTLPARAWAVATLRGIETGDGAIELQFDDAVDARTVRTEYFRDIIQVSIDGASVYPAKIVSVPSGSLSKVFAYQYTPRQIRCRLSVRGDAEKYQGRVRVAARGRTVSIRVEEPAAKTDSVTVKAAQAVRAGSGGVAAKSKTPAPAPEKLTGGKDLPSPFSGFAWLGALMLLAGVAWTVARKLRGRGNRRSSGGAKARLSGIIGDFTKRAFGGKAGMIEIVSTHHLSPRQSIAVVDVGGRRLVLGITQEAISLITRLDGEGAARGADEAVAQDEPSAEPAAAPAKGEGFSALLEVEATRPAAAPGAPSGSIDRIRRKLEGYKTI
jgi:flagellar biogenesis protein FliO